MFMKKVFLLAAGAAFVMTYVAQGFSPAYVALRMASVAQGFTPAIAQGQPAAVSALPSFGEPGISPDGSTIAFVSGGDIWEVPARGGDARLLVSHPATESRPLFSPDGKRLAFTSTRTGNGDVYVLAIPTGDVTRLTFDDANELVSGWSADSQSVLFQSNSHEISGMLDVYRVSADGGTPMPVAADRYTTEYFAAPSPGGEAVAITARANAGSQWWRKGHSHLDESEIWIVKDTAYTQITKGGAKDAWPMWAAGGKGLYFMSDRSGAQNIWSVSSLGVQSSPGVQGSEVPGSGAKAVTTFKDGRVLWPSISKDGKTIAFERDFGIWTVDTATSQAREVAITLRGAPAATSVEHRTFSDQLQELALSPDGKKAAFTVHGEIFSVSAKDGGDAVRVTDTAGEEREIVWAPNSRQLAYMSDRDGTNHLYTYDFGTGKETQLTNGAGRDDMPRYSPDGKWVAFERDSKELRVIDPATKAEKLLATGIFDVPPFADSRDFAWSPDSRFVAYLTAGTKAFQNVHVVPAAGGEARAISFLANANAGSLSWSPDGTYLTFATSQRTEPGDVMRIDLLPRTPKFREDQFRDLFREEQPKTPSTPSTPPSPSTPPAPPAPPSAAEGRARSVEIVYEEIRRRATALPVGLDVTGQEISPDGKSLLLTASAAGQQNLYVFPIDELSKEPAIARQLTSTPGPKRSAHFTADSKEVYYLDRGRLFNVTLEKREPKAIAVAAELDVDFSREKNEAFRQAWTYLRDQFFDEKMNGVDWNAVRTMYGPRVAGARTPDEMRRILSMMLGELNASHMGISAPPQGTQTSLGRLAADFDRAAYDAGGRLKVAAVVPLGPATIAGVQAGDYILQVDGHNVGARANLDALLDHTVGKRIALSVASTPSGTPREVIVKPVDQATEKALRYRQWVEQRREYVAKASGGRLGYVHMFDMSANALAQLHVDLDADNHAKQGVVVDVRNNNGGFVNVYAIDVFARRGYMNMMPRGYPLLSSRPQLGQRALELPTILVTNQHSLSDAEDFTEGYRSLKLGKVVGEPTAGWIIFTGSVTLIDGSILRMPGWKIFAADGTPMEMHPRAVDVAVTRPVGESYSGKDSQLDAAVAELLKQLGPATKSTAGAR
jgi:Tol biopolymer transport system component/C-terminal processing protease CtpA/Prc